jgi:hypothetical protein
MSLPSINFGHFSLASLPERLDFERSSYPAAFLIGCITSKSESLLPIDTALACVIVGVELNYMTSRQGCHCATKLSRHPHIMKVATREEYYLIESNSVFHQSRNGM